MTIDLDQLERIASGATPGPWTASCRHCSGPTDIEGIAAWSDDEFLGCEIEGPTEPDGRGSFVGRDAAYIAAANPAVLLQLIAEVRRLRTAEAMVLEFIGALLSNKGEKAREVVKRMTNYALDTPDGHMPCPCGQAEERV